jgi:spore germination cell wall hydrolase CwlJ-like protein
MKKFTIFASQIALMAATVGYAHSNISPPTEMYNTVQFNIDETELHCMAEAIYFEGRNQTIPGMAAIGMVVMNRVQSPDFPNTVCGVVHQGPLDGSPIKKHKCQFSYYCDGKSDNFPVSDNIAEVAAADWASLVAEMVMYTDMPDITSGSTYYHANYVSPFWGKVYDHVTTVDTHEFYVHYTR